MRVTRARLVCAAEIRGRKPLCVVPMSGTYLSSTFADSLITLPSSADHTMDRSLNTGCQRGSGGESEQPCPRRAGVSDAVSPSSTMSPPLRVHDASSQLILSVQDGTSTLTNPKRKTNAWEQWAILHSEVRWTSTSQVPSGVEAEQTSRHNRRERSRLQLGRRESEKSVLAPA